MITTYQLIVNELKYYLQMVEPNDRAYSQDEKQAAYTESGKYLIYTTYYHDSIGLPELMKRIYEQPFQTVIDIGCCSGITGLIIAIDKKRAVTFHDFEGLGLRFIRWFIEKHGLNTCKVIPYGDNIEYYDLVVGLDVIEHTGNHLGFIRWINDIGDVKFITHPLMDFAPPYVNVLDEWVDGDAISLIIRSRYEMLFDYKQNNRRFMAWK